MITRQELRNTARILNELGITTVVIQESKKHQITEATLHTSALAPAKMMLDRITAQNFSASASLIDRSDDNVRAV